MSHHDKKSSLNPSAERDVTHPVSLDSLAEPLSSVAADRLYQLAAVTAGIFFLVTLL